MNNIFTKLKDFVGISEQPEDEDETDYEEMNWEQFSPQDRDQNEEEEPLNRRQREPLNLNTATSMGLNRSNVIGMPGINNNNAEVVVIEPHSFEEMPQVIQTLRERKSVVLNLNVMDPEEAQRAVDFVAGGTYAIDGHQERIGESIFLFTPSCVKVSTLSGTIHDITDNPKMPRSISSPPAWGAESSRLAQ
ncbi:MAG: cell division protein SepF [Microcystis novacekii Mn_MB_F_20050700_S1]|uniref:Cell division protein SepF n=1 Tax=Microcystis novacekii Mn_MB_F_20050700_S1D TaxID=2486266 RepID=A0A552IQT1_9CHRO|nr:MAG: cell division protein SepF [Microcystis novacekii Mn_MB_F_20050700_S1D]TRU88555.1 MAG: cell division protein SepF [Microcystis novacekii Mn_MB_F_20050700_S1]